MKKLPPIPGSDPKTLKNNRYEPFYKKKPSDVWEGADINRKKITKPKKCDHYFEEKGAEVVCRKCHMGLTGKGLTVKEGKLYAHNQEVDFSKSA